MLTTLVVLYVLAAWLTAFVYTEWFTTSTDKLRLCFMCLAWPALAVASILLVICDAVIQWFRKA